MRPYGGVIEFCVCVKSTRLRFRIFCRDRQCLRSKLAGLPCPTTVLFKEVNTRSRRTAGDGVHEEKCKATYYQYSHYSEKNPLYDISAHISRSLLFRLRPLCTEHRYTRGTHFVPHSPSGRYVALVHRRNLPKIAS